MLDDCTLYHKQLLTHHTRRLRYLQHSYNPVCGCRRSEGAAIMPIYQSATFGHHGFLGSRPEGEFTCYYTRPADNPNHRVGTAECRPWAQQLRVCLLLAICVCECRCLERN